MLQVLPEVKVSQALDVDGYCREVIRQGYERKSDFLNIECEATTPFLFGLGHVSIMKVGNLRKAQNEDGTSPYEHVGMYRMGRYLDISADPKSKRYQQDIEKRGFFSWPQVAAQSLKIDPELEVSQDEDIICIAHDNDGHILAHLGINWLPSDRADEPMDPSKRINETPLEMEELYGSEFILQDPLLMNLRMGQVAVLNRYSSVPHLPAIPDFFDNNPIIKAKIMTHLSAAAFIYINSIREERDLKALMFDGEDAARKGVELAGGFKMQGYKNVGYKNIPAILYPRYYDNNRELVNPYSIDLSQLDDPRIAELQGKLESGSITTFAGLVMKNSLQRVTAMVTNKMVGK
jgi:hypothetical protein